MKRLAPAFAFLVVSCGSAPARDEQGLRAANAAYDRAIVAGDRAALERFLASDYVYISPEAAVRDRAATIGQLTSGDFRIVSSGSEDVQIRWLGDTALVTGRFRAQVTMGGRTFPNDERYTSLWTRGEEGWQVRHEHASTTPQPATNMAQ